MPTEVKQFCPLKPTLNRVVVRMIEAPDKIGSIWIPDDAQEQPQQAEVLAVGPGADGQPPPPFHIGDRVIFAKYSGVEYKFVRNENTEKYLILAERDILAVVHDDAALIERAKGLVEAETEA